MISSSPTRAPTPALIRQLDGRALRRDPGNLTVGTPVPGGADEIRRLLDELDPRRDRVAQFSLHQASLDDVFLALTGHGTSTHPDLTQTMNDTALSIPYRPSGRRHFVNEARTLVLRGLRLTLRNTESLTTAVALPVLLMLMFVYLFGGAIHTGTRYVDYVVPGVLLVCIGFGAGTTALSVSQDLAGGMIDRLRSMDVRGETLINGHVIASVLRNLLSTLIVLGVALAIGFRPHGHAVNWVAAIGIATLYMLAISWLAAAIGVLARTPEAAQGITFLISFLAYPAARSSRSTPCRFATDVRRQPARLADRRRDARAA